MAWVGLSVTVCCRQPHLRLFRDGAKGLERVSETVLLPICS